ncbi:MAG: 50S ribosomal protein L6 [Burkholderiales bacterium]
MSRVGKLPIPLPIGIEASCVGDQFSVKGPLGSLSRSVSSFVNVSIADGKVIISPVDSTVKANAMSGTERALIANMVAGVSKGFQRKLALVGVGFRAQASSGSDLHLQIGFSHPVIKSMPAGVKLDCPTPTEIVLTGPDKCVLGEIASRIRKIRPPEPYKGKGIRYSYPPEEVRRKVAKKK